MTIKGHQKLFWGTTHEFQRTLDCTDPQKLDQESNEWRSVFL